MFSYFNQGGRHRAEGVEVLRYRISLPVFPEQTVISNFYEDIFKLVLGYCENELKNYAEGRYTKCDMPKKKFNYPPVFYTLDGKVTYEDSEIIFVKLTAETKQRGFSDLWRKAYDAHAWSLPDELLLPPKQAAAVFLEKKKIPKSLGAEKGFLVENGKYYVCCKDRMEEIAF